MEEAESTIHASHLIQDPKSGMICIEYSNQVKKKYIPAKWSVLYVRSDTSPAKHITRATWKTSVEERKIKSFNIKICHFYSCREP